MIKASYNDRRHVVFLLAQAFEDNQSVNYIIKQDNRKADRLKALMEYSFDNCFCFGEVYLSDNRDACALLLPPGSKKAVFRSLWLDFKLIFKAIGIDRIGIALKRETAIKKKQIKGNVQYLWFIGVDPKMQHKGIGSQLLQEVIDLTDQASQFFCLETSTLKNLPWYERFGFQVYDELELGYRLYFLKRSNF